MSVFLSQIPCYGITAEMTEAGADLVRKASVVIRSYYPAPIGEKLLKAKKLRIVHHFDALPARIKYAADSSGFDHAAWFDEEEDAVWVDARHADAPDFMAEITACAAFARSEPDDPELSESLTRHLTTADLLDIEGTGTKEVTVFHQVEKTLAALEGLTPADAPYYQTLRVYRLALIGLTDFQIPIAELLSDKKAAAWIKSRKPPKLSVFEELRFSAALALMRVKTWAKAKDDDAPVFIHRQKVRPDPLAIPGVPARNVASFTQSVFPAPEAFFGEKAAEEIARTTDFVAPGIRMGDPVNHCLDVSDVDLEPAEITEASKPLAGFDVRPWAYFKGECCRGEKLAKDSFLAALFGRFYAPQLNEYADGVIIPRATAKVRRKAVLTHVQVAPRLDWAELTFSSGSKKSAAGCFFTAFAGLWCMQAGKLRARTPVNLDLIVWAEKVEAVSSETGLKAFAPAAGGKTSDAYVAGIAEVTASSTEGILGGEKYLRLTCKTHATGRPAMIDVLVRESLFAAPVTEKMHVKITGWLIAGEMELIDAVPAQLRDFPEKDDMVAEGLSHPGVRRRLRLRGTTLDVLKLAASTSARNVLLRRKVYEGLTHIAQKSPAALAMAAIMNHKHHIDTLIEDEFHSYRELGRAVLAAVPQAAGLLGFAPDVKLGLKRLIGANLERQLFLWTRMPKALLKYSIPFKDYAPGTMSKEAQIELNVLTTAAGLGDMFVPRETARRIALGIGTQADNDLALEILSLAVETPSGMLDATAFSTLGPESLSMSDTELVKRFKALCREDASPRNLLTLVLALARGGREADPQAMLLGLKIIEFVSEKTALPVLQDIRSIFETGLTPEEKKEFPTFDIKAALNLESLPELNFDSFTTTVSDPAEGMLFSYAGFVKELTQGRDEAALFQYLDFMMENAAAFSDPVIRLQKEAEDSPYEFWQWVDADTAEHPAPVPRLLVVADKVQGAHAQTGVKGAMRGMYPFFAAGTGALIKPMKAIQTENEAMGQFVTELMSPAADSGAVIVHAVDALWAANRPTYKPGTWWQAQVAGIVMDLGAGADAAARKMAVQVPNFTELMPGMLFLTGRILEVNEHWASIAGVAFARILMKLEGELAFDTFPLYCPQAMFDESRKVVKVAPGEMFTAVAMLQLYVTQEAYAVTDAKKTLH